MSETRNKHELTDEDLARVSGGHPSEDDGDGTGYNEGDCFYEVIPTGYFYYKIKSIQDLGGFNAYFVDKWKVENNIVTDKVVDDVLYFGELFQLIKIANLPAICN